MGAIIVECADSGREASDDSTRVESSPGNQFAKCLHSDLGRLVSGTKLTLRERIRLFL